VLAHGERTTTHVEPLAPTCTPMEASFWLIHSLSPQFPYQGMCHAAADLLWQLSILPCHMLTSTGHDWPKHFGSFLMHPACDWMHLPFVTDAPNSACLGSLSYRPPVICMSRRRHWQLVVISPGVDFRHQLFNDTECACHPCGQQWILHHQY